MTSMVERVARAIYGMADDQHGVLPRWIDLQPDTKEAMRARARKAIAAMREPTEGMRDAGRLALRDDWSRVGVAYRSMIDEALRDG